jgi:hypothetical protein
MNVSSLGKLTATLLLGGALAGCIDAKVDVTVTSEQTAKVTLTQIMSAEFYAMVKESAEENADASDDDFCAEGTLTELADGSATCVDVKEGAFADLDFGDEEGSVEFASAGPGLVRVSLPTADMKAEIGADDEMDAETRSMLEAFFTGHAVTVSFSGAEVTETNMTLSADKTSAETVIPFLDLINGTVELPDELYAIVKAN